MSTGSKIANARRSKNLTQEQLAEMLSVTRQSVSRWESEQSYPEMDKIILLSNILEVSCDYLLHDTYKEEQKELVSPTNSISRLLYAICGKTVRLTFFGDAIDMDLSNVECIIKEFDGQWAHVEYKKRKKEMSKMIPVSSILSIAIINKEKQ